MYRHRQNVVLLLYTPIFVVKSSSLILRRYVHQCSSLSQMCIWTYLHYVHFLGLAVQHWLAEEAYIFCCCTFLFFKIYLSAHRYYKTSVAAGDAHKISTDIRPMLPPFLQRGKMPKNFGPNFNPIVFGPPYFWTAAIYRKTETNLSRIDDRSTVIPNSGSVGLSNSENSWRNGYSKG